MGRSVQKSKYVTSKGNINVLKICPICFYMTISRQLNIKGKNSQLVI